MDQVWNSIDDDEAYDKDIANRNYKKLSSTHENLGYREGVHSGKQLDLQKGFDSGFSTGAAAALEIGQLTGNIQALLLCFDSSTNKSVSLKVQLQDLLDRVQTLSKSALKSSLIDQSEIDAIKRHVEHIQSQIF